MNKLVSVLALLVMVLIARPLMAESGYISASTGVGFPYNSTVTVNGVAVNNAITYNTGVPFIGAIGVKGEGYRIEAAVGYQSSDVESANYNFVHIPIVGVSASITSYMANWYWDLVGGNSSVIPYLMAGVGAASLSNQAKLT